ncbi:hypothetical protein ACFQ8E_11730 [Isoptericola sp. NPDC056573]|uniref:hypothetical protein n=1 Tax=Isoptericola sp. NPDC056573 TaxID=3345868 RepID=UPI003692D2B9
MTKGLNVGTLAGFVDRELTDFFVDRNVVISGLRALWHESEILPQIGLSEMRDVGCFYHGTELWVSRGAAGIMVDGDLNHGFEAVTWYRSLVPDHLVVTVSDPAYTYSAEVPPGTTADGLRTLVANSGGATVDF